MRKWEGPRLAALFFGGMLLIGALVLGMAIGSPRVAGACAALLGLGILLAYNEFGEVLYHLNWPRLVTLSKAAAILFGAALMVTGVSMIVTGDE